MGRVYQMQQGTNYDENLNSNKQGNGGGGGDMESRVAKLESAVEHIQSDVTEVKSDTKEIRIGLSDFKTQTAQDFSNIHIVLGQFENRMIKWFVVTAIAIAGIGFAIARFMS